MAFSNQFTTFTVPFGATSGPRIVLDGDTGTITVYGNNDDDKIIITPEGPGGKPIINFQDSDAPGDLLAGIQWDEANGLVFRGWEYIENEYGETVRAYLSLLENAVTLGFRESANPNLVGGGLTLTDGAGTLRYVRHDGVTLYSVACTPDGISISANDGSLVEQEEFTTANDTRTGVTTYGQGTVNGIDFVAPHSGAVEVTVTGWLGSSSVTVNRRCYLSTEFRVGAVVGAGAIALGGGASDDLAAVYDNHTTSAGFKYSNVAVTRRMTGLTPGTTYNVTSVFRTDNAAETAAVNKRRMFLRPIILEVA